MGGWTKGEYQGMMMMMMQRSIERKNEAAAGGHLLAMLDQSHLKPRRIFSFFTTLFRLLQENFC